MPEADHFDRVGVLAQTAVLARKSAIEIAIFLAQVVAENGAAVA